MGRRRSYFISVLFLGAFLLCCLSDSKELFHEFTCYHDSLEVDCGIHSIIAIHQAYFTSQRQENHTCLSSLIEHEYVDDENSAKFNHTYCYEDVRVAINQRCSGLKSCNITYSDEVEKRCSNPDGVLVVHYDCVRKEKINKYCNDKEITATEGYIMQPGYPKYYPNLDCSWNISAAEGQTINVKILHLHLSAATEVVPTVSEHEAMIYAMGIGQLTEPITQCDKDSLSAFEGNTTKLFSICGQDLDGLRTIETGARNVVLNFKSPTVAPFSGFLAYYKIEGCPDMPAGENSYLVQRNATAAVYACRNDLVFNDTLENSRFLHCIRNHHWSNTLSPCIQLAEDTTSKSLLPITAFIPRLENTTSQALNESVSMEPEPRFTEDVIIPCVIIAILILGNSVIVVIICIMRRKRKEDTEEDEEEEDLEQPKNNASP